MKVAILGGGQLGRMLGLEGAPLGAEFSFLEPAPDPPAGAVGEIVQAGYEDAAGLARVVEGAEAVTYEFENVPVAAARELVTRLPVRPPPAALEMAQDRVVEKESFRAVGIPTAPFHPLDRVDEVEAALEVTGLPAVIKTRRLGYDGKGQAVVTTASEARAAVETLGTGLVAEAFVEFDRELSLVAVAGLHDDHRFYPLTENHHEDGILRLSYAPAQDVPESVRAQAESYGRAVIERLGYVGVLAIEFFQQGDRLLANEMAPRVHNSGHWTLDGARVSQFENHIRAVLGLPLGDTGATGHSVMVNLIGQVPSLEELLRVPHAHVHMYGKEPRPGRKLGHVNVTAPDRGAVLEAAARVACPGGLVGPTTGAGGAGLGFPATPRGPRSPRPRPQHTEGPPCWTKSEKSWSRRSRRSRGS